MFFFSNYLRDMFHTLLIIHSLGKFNDDNNVKKNV